jgi:Ca2+-binding RTX toxin-like protein
MSNFLRFLSFGAWTLVLLGVVTAVAATNTVPSTRLDLKSASIGINHLKPAVCAGIIVTNLITGAGTITGTAGNDLILGSSGADSIDGAGGDDCILGGGGDDQITGGDGNDVCLGGPGMDEFTACEGEYQ